MGKQQVSYFYHPDCPLFYYGPSHPMKPFRLRLTHQLLLNYGLTRQMDCYRPHPAQHGEMAYFHQDEYLHFLKKISAIPDTKSLSSSSLTRQCQKYNVGPNQDCPAFDGLYEFNQLLTGASLDAAVQLATQQTDIAINWAGGFHHAKKAEASGFCYVNDIVLAICEMLKVYARVLYVDIDVHHGDGVEEAFYTTDRVMTLSLHKYAPEENFFPGTGALPDKGAKRGQGYSLNVPLRSGITDTTYFDDIFRPVFDKIMEIYQPQAIFLQCGADSLAADRLGTFNLTTRGHARMVQHVKEQNVPLLVSGGGGYTIRNVARAWCYETAVLLDQPNIDNTIPFHDYYEYFAPTYELHLQPEQAMKNLNAKERIESMRVDLLQQIQELQGAPSVAMHQAPPLYSTPKDDDEDGDESQRAKRPRKQKKQHPSELYDKLD